MNKLQNLIATAAAGLLVTLTATGCTFEGHMTSAETGTPYVEVHGFAIDHATAEGILVLVNDPLTDVAFLDHDCQVDQRAAERIVAHRQGPDGLDGNLDDDLFDDLFELDDVGHVGPETLDRLGEMAHELDLVPAVQVEGIAFTAGERQDTLLLVNMASVDELDADAGLDVRAAEALVHGRPYTDLFEVADRPWVGPSALEDLRAFCGDWVDANGEPVVD
jgi:hypothetical protein